MGLSGLTITYWSDSDESLSSSSDARAVDTGAEVAMWGTDFLGRPRCRDGPLYRFSVCWGEEK